MGKIGSGVFYTVMLLLFSVGGIGLGYSALYAKSDPILIVAGVAIYIFSVVVVGVVICCHLAREKGW